MNAYEYASPPSVTISQTTHARHDAENVVVDSINAEVLGVSGGHSEREGGIVDTGHIDSAGGLMLLGVKSEGVDIDVLSVGFSDGVVYLSSCASSILFLTKSQSTVSARHVSVVLVGLDAEEILGAAFLEAVLAVELELNGTSAEGLELARLGYCIATATSTVSSLADPDEFLARVVEAKVNTLGRARKGFITSELELLNQVFVADLGETTAFISVKVDVVNPELNAVST